MESDTDILRGLLTSHSETQAVLFATKKKFFLSSIHTHLANTFKRENEVI